jgi:hypothetical protein
MSDWVSGVAAGLTALATPVVIRALLARTDATALRESGAFVLRYGRAWLGFLAASAALLLPAFAALLIVADLDAQGRYVVLGLDALLMALFGFSAVEVAKVAHLWTTSPSSAAHRGVDRCGCPGAQSFRFVTSPERGGCCARATERRFDSPFI